MLDDIDYASNQSPQKPAISKKSKSKLKKQRRLIISSNVVAKRKTKVSTVLNPFIFLISSGSNWI